MLWTHYLLKTFYIVTALFIQSAFNWGFTTLWMSLPTQATLWLYEPGYVFHTCPNLQAVQRGKKIKTRKEKKRKRPTTTKSTIKKYLEGCSPFACRCIYCLWHKMGFTAVLSKRFANTFSMRSIWAIRKSLALSFIDLVMDFRISCTAVTLAQAEDRELYDIRYISRTLTCNGQ